jgi:hypothetical protein
MHPRFQRQGRRGEQPGEGVAGSIFVKLFFMRRVYSSGWAANGFIAGLPSLA